MVVQIAAPAGNDGEMNDTTIAPAMETAIHILSELGDLAFVWLPRVFAASAIWRRRVGLRFVFIAISAEAMTMAYFDHRRR